MRRFVSTTIGIVAAAVGAGVGGACMTMTGVMSVEIELKPADVVTWPEGVDATAYLSLPTAGGFVYVDAMAETGKIQVGPLPMPAEGYIYLAILDVADDPRGSLPGGRTVDMDRPVVALSQTSAEGWWSASFTDDETAGSLGGLRAARIVLVGVGGELVLLSGSVADQAAAAPPLTQPGGTHVH